MNGDGVPDTDDDSSLEPILLVTLILTEYDTPFSSSFIINESPTTLAVTHSLSSTLYSYNVILEPPLSGIVKYTVNIESSVVILLIIGVSGTVKVGVPDKGSESIL